MRKVWLLKACAIVAMLWITGNVGEAATYKEGRKGGVE
jgi:hypothetical protein